MRPVHFLLLVVASCALLGGCGRKTCSVPVFEAQGHRGARAARPENTLPAFEYALSRGVTTLELDLAVTQDEVLVVSHDPVLLSERCMDAQGQPANSVAINSLTLEQLRTFDCGSQKHPDFPDQQTVPHTPPPTLREVFELAELRTAGRIHYNVEPKMDPANDSLTPDAETFVSLLEAEIDRAGVADRTIVESFDARPLRVLQQHHSQLHRALLWPATTASLIAQWAFNNPVDNATAVGADILSPYAPIVSPTLIGAAHLHGLAVIPWTENSAAKMKKLMDQGVDGLISDDVDELMKQVAQNKPRGGLCLQGEP